MYSFVYLSSPEEKIVVVSQLNVDYGGSHTSIQHFMDWTKQTSKMQFIFNQIMFQKRNRLLI